MKKILLIMAFLYSVFSWGQLLQWNTFGNAGTEITEPSVFNNTNISSSNLILGPGVAAASNGDRFGGNNWFDTGNATAGSTLAEAIAGNNYIEFIVTPNSGYSFTPTSFVFLWDRSMTGPQNVALRSSSDTYTSNLGTVLAIPSSISSNTITITGLSNITVATTFRIYGYGATATAGTGGFDTNTNAVNVTLNGTVTSTGPISVTSGDWNVGATWNTGAVPLPTDNVIISATHIVHTTTSLARTGNTLVNGTFELRDGGFADGAGTFTYNGATGSLNFNLSTGSYGVDNTHKYWPTTNGPFNVNVLNNGMNLNAGANRTVNGTFSTANGGTFGISFPAATLTLNGICRINAGGFFNQSPIYGSSSTLLYNSGGTYGRGLEWSHNGVGTIGVTPGYPNNIQLSNNTTLNYTNGIPLNKAIAGDLNIDFKSHFNMAFGGGNCNGTLTVAGSITNSGNFTLGNAAGDDLRLNGNYSNAGLGSFNGNGRAIFFTRNGSQKISSSTPLIIPYVVFQPSSGNTKIQLATDVTVSAPVGGNAIAFSSANDVFDINGSTLTIGTASIPNVVTGLGTFSGSTTSSLSLFGKGSIGVLRFTPGSQILRGLTLDRQAGAIGFELGTRLTINSDITLKNGIVNLEGQILTLDAGVTTVNDASPSNYIIADFSLGGLLRKNFANGTGVTGKFTFPLGDRIASDNGTQYSPATVIISSGDFSTGQLSMSVQDSKEPNNEAPIDFISRYWNLTSVGISNANYSFTGTYLPVDINGTEANSKSGRLKVSDGIWLEGANLTTGANIVSLTGMDTSINALSSSGGYNYTAGSPFKRAEINIQQSSLNVLTGTTFNFGSQGIGISTVVTFTIQNVGIETLNLGAATLTGAAYNLTSAYSSTVGSNSFTTFQITFTPSSAATFLGSISIPNNDVTGSESPYIINFTGVGQCLFFDFEGASKGGYAADELLVNGKNWLFSEALLGGLTNDYFTGTQSVRMRADANGFIEMLEDQTVGVSDIIFNYRRYGTDPITASFVVEYSKDLGNSWYQIGTPIVPTATVQIFNQTLNQSGPVRIRIRYFSGITSQDHRINIDNLQLCNYNNLSEIEVFGNATTVQNASTVTKLENNTLFSSNYFVGDGIITKTFTVTNRGTGTLTLSNPTITGAPEFTLATGLTGTSLTAGQSASFSVNFSAITTGLKTATLSMVNNDSNENPFTFNVETNVNNFVRCSLGALETIVQQDFEASPAAPVLAFSGSGGSFSSVGGQAFGSSRSIQSNKFIGGRSYQVIGGVNNELTFNTFDVSNYQNISLSFNAGAYATTSGQGMESGDELKVSISINGGTTWSEQIRIRGNNNSIFDINSATGSGINHVYNAAITSPSNYACTNNSTNTFSNTIKISNLPNSTQLRVKIEFNFNSTGGDQEIWAIDNVKLEGQLPSIKTWNAGWIPVGAPTTTDKVIIDGTYNTGVDGDLLGCECQINSGKTLTVTTGNFIEIQSNIRNEGTISIQNSGSLIQIDDLAVNTGAGAVSLARIATIKLNDYVYWSTPVFNTATGKGNAITTVSIDTPLSKIWKWIPTVSGNFGTWTNTAENMEIGKGYIVRGPNSHSPTVASNHTATFLGKQNNGIINVPIQRGGYVGGPYSGPSGTVTNEDDNWNLVGNPYPSAIDAIKFLQQNTNIAGNVRIWTHQTDAVQANPNPFYNSYAYNYSANDYATYNSSGTNTGPSFGGKIASGQGFFITMNDGPATNSQTVVFKNEMRNRGYDNSQFFKGNNTTVAEIERNRIWLDLVSSNGEVNRTLVGYIEGATMGPDRLYDASLYPSSLSLHSLIGVEAQTIQARPIPFDNDDQVPMGIFIETAGNYTIAIATVDGLFTDAAQQIYIEDKVLNVIHDLRQAPYAFATTAGQFNERFVLRYTNTVLNSQSFENTNELVIVSDKAVSLRASENIKSVLVFDMLGRKVYEKNNINATEFVLDKLMSTKEALVVKTTFESGQVSTKKIIF